MLPAAAARWERKRAWTKKRPEVKAGPDACLAKGMTNRESMAVDVREGTKCIKYMQDGTVGERMKDV